MRTRLDEIVEEEFLVCYVAGDYRLAGKRIAERAFRHGVERGAYVQFLRGYGGTPPLISGPEVQPAPAGEKCAWCGKGPHEYEICGHRYAPTGEKTGSHHTYASDVCGLRRWCCEKATGVTFVCEDPAREGFYPCGCLIKDRRKGKRRTRNEQIRWLDGEGELWVNKGYRDIGKNRRSGKDRRKG